jgi:hypothetical protein
VAWRAHELVADPEETLLAVLRQALDRAATTAREGDASAAATTTVAV